MKIEIIIPTINLWTQYTKPALDTVFEAMVRAKAHEFNCHVLLIDNASTDSTQAEAAKLEGELLHYQRNNDMWGFQKTVNFGVAYAWEHGADFALILNNDIVLHSEAIWRLAQRMAKGDVGMATCMDVAGEMKENKIPPQDIARLLAQDKESVDEAPHPCFSAFMISKKCWDEVGEFDEGFAPAYFEDNDYHWRTQQIGMLAIVYPPAMFYHYASRTQNEAMGFQLVNSYMFLRNRDYYVKKWGGTPGAEKFSVPFDDAKLSIKYTKQKP